jgi:hypothetical protein
MKDIKSFIVLKYQIFTEDRSTWHLCETYPKIVRMKWALRCARDVEHLSSKYPKVKACNDLTQKYIDSGMPESMHEELMKAGYAAYATDHAARAAHAATYADAYGATAATAAAAAARVARSGTAKWKQYIDWLVEELANYEEQS